MAKFGVPMMVATGLPKNLLGVPTIHFGNVWERLMMVADGCLQDAWDRTGHGSSSIRFRRLSALSLLLRNSTSSNSWTVPGDPWEPMGQGVEGPQPIHQDGMALQHKFQL